MTASLHTTTPIYDRINNTQHVDFAQFKLYDSCMERTRLHNLAIGLHDLSMCSSMEGVRLHNLSTRVHDLSMCSKKELGRLNSISITLHDLALRLIGRVAWRMADRLVESGERA
jgi:hypothetical protein